MSKTLFKNYIWLLDTIYRTGNITFEEINRKWRRSELSEDKEMPLRTFHNWKEKVQEIFEIRIECNKGTNEYFIGNSEDLQKNSIKTWLLNSFAVSNLLQESTQIKNRISLENIPSGLDFLTAILESIQENIRLKITYKSYRENHSTTFRISPFAVKLFKQRWYVLAKSEIDELWTYALDRIKSVEKTSEKFIVPDDFDVEIYFANCYGIIYDTNIDTQIIRLKVSASQSNYLRDLPLHHSQKEIEQTQKHSVFEYYLKPTYDFIQEILKFNEHIEVLSPEKLRKEITDILKNTSKKYES